VLEQQWDKTVGIDFVQEEDRSGSQEPYDAIANKVLAKFPDLDIKKVYHAGETNDHSNRNVEIAINAGSVRIGHGINILQHPQLIAVCREKGICFEKNPISNIFLGYVKDPRMGTAQLLLGLGVPVTISPDDPGKFGLPDTTMDIFATLVSSNWDLRHLKLIALHSINHAIASEEHRKELLCSFNRRWDAWV
jgi:adenosine deaminase